MFSAWTVISERYVRAVETAMGVGRLPRRAMGGLMGAARAVAASERGMRSVETMLVVVVVGVGKLLC